MSEHNIVACWMCYGGQRQTWYKPPESFDCKICKNTGKITEVELLRHKIENLRREITIKDQSLAQKNLELDSMHYVWCSGGCSKGIHRYELNKHLELTEELIERAKSNIRRMELSLMNVRSRRKDEEEERKKDL